MPKFFCTVLRTRKVVDRLVVEVEAETPEIAVVQVEKMNYGIDIQTDEHPSGRRFGNTRYAPKRLETFVTNEDGMVLGLRAKDVIEAKKAAGLHTRDNSGSLSSIFEMFDDMRDVSRRARDERTKGERTSAEASTAGSSTAGSSTAGSSTAGSSTAETSTAEASTGEREKEDAPRD